MDDFATLSASERREIIAEAAIGMRREFTIVEKDFWVCWTLRSLFSLPSGHAPMVFKGGTALSKAYELIQRFSEDIDVVTDVNFYLARGVADPETAPSRTQQLERMAALDAACADYICGALMTELRQQFVERLGTDAGWELLVDPDDRYAHSLLFRYPISAPEIEHLYIRGLVKLELGWRSTTTPAETRTFKPYVAEHFPNLMESPDVHCRALSPARTFWEKVTALHAESFRDEVPHFFSRHYSDVAAMFQTDLGKAASRDRAILDDVREFKQRYYPAAWARYDLAVPGTLAIVPSDGKMGALASDYRDMRMMFFASHLHSSNSLNSCVFCRPKSMPHRPGAESENALLAPVDWAKVTAEAESVRAKLLAFPALSMLGNLVLHACWAAMKTDAYEFPQIEYAALVYWHEASDASGCATVCGASVQEIAMALNKLFFTVQRYYQSEVDRANGSPDRADLAYRLRSAGLGIRVPAYDVPPRALKIAHPGALQNRTLPGGHFHEKVVFVKAAVAAGSFHCSTVR